MSITAQTAQNFEVEQSLGAAGHITSIPTLMAFRDGPLVFSLPGASSAAGLEQAGDGVRALAMDATRTQHAQQNQPA